MDSHIDAVLDEIRKAFDEIDKWIHVPFFEFLVSIPEGNENALYDLADKYNAAAVLYADHVNEISLYLKDLYSNWSGDGAAMVAANTLQAYVQQVSQTGQAMSDMSGIVRGNALSIESTKWMDVVNLIMLIITLIQVIITLWCTFGGSALEGAGAVAICKQALAIAWRQLLEKLTVKTMVKLAVERAIQFAAFTAVTKFGIYAIEAAEGHDPTWDWKSFAGEILDSFTTGLIGGPLSFGMHNPLTEALSMALGQVGDNLFKLLRSELFDTLNMTDWAKQWGLYEDPAHANLLDGVAQGALFGAVMGAGGMGKELPKLLGAAKAELGLGDLGLAKDPALAPSTMDQPGTLTQDATQGQEGTGSLTENNAGTVAGASDAPGVSDAAVSGTGGGAQSVTTEQPGATEQTPAEQRSTAEQPGAMEQRPAEQPGAAEQPRAEQPSTETGTGTGDVRSNAKVDETGNVQGDQASSTEQRPGEQSATSTGDSSGSGDTTGSMSQTGSSDKSVANEQSGATEQPLADRPGITEQPRAEQATSTDGMHTDEPGRAEAGTGDVRSDTTGGEAGKVEGDQAGRTEQRPGEQDSASSGDKSGSADKGASGDKTTSTDRTESDKTPESDKPGSGDRRGDAPAREKPRFYEWKKKFALRIEEGYQHRIAQEFLGKEGKAPLSLHTDMIEQALEQKDLNAFGNRLRDFLQTHFTERAEDGTTKVLDDAGIRSKLVDLGKFTAKVGPAAAQRVNMDDPLKRALEDVTSTSSEERWVAADADSPGRDPTTAQYERGRGLLGEVLDKHFGRTDWDPSSPAVASAVHGWVDRVLKMSAGEFRYRPEAAEVRSFFESHFGHELEDGRIGADDPAAISTRLREMYGDGPRSLDLIEHRDGELPGSTEHADTQPPGGHADTQPPAGHGDTQPPTGDVPGGHDTVNYAQSQPPEPTPHGALVRYENTASLEWSTDSRYIRSVEVKRIHFEQEFERFPVENYAGGADGPEARAATHQAALTLVDILHERQVNAMHDWFGGTDLKDTYLAESGRTASAVMLSDGRLFASTSVKDIAGDRLSRPAAPGEAAGLPRTKNAAEAAESPVNHPAIQEVLDNIPPELKSAFRDRCGEPSTLSAIARAIEGDFKTDYVSRAGVDSLDKLSPEQQAAYHRDLSAEVANQLRGGQITSHFATGIDEGREQFPCASDDLLIDHFGMHTDYVDRIIDQSHIDPANGVISLVPPGDPLRGPAEMVASAHRDTLVVVMHGDLTTEDFGGIVGGDRLGHVEVARLIKTIVAGHEELQGRSKVVVLSCDAAGEHQGIRTGVETSNRPPTSFANELARRLGTDVVAPKDTVWISDVGQVWAGSDPSLRAAFEPGSSDAWIQADRYGDIGEAPAVNDLVGRKVGPPAGGGPEHWERAQGGSFGDRYAGGDGGTGGASVPRTGFVPEGRPPHLPDVWEGEFRDAARQVLPEDFGNGSVVQVEPDGALVRVETADGQVHYLRPEVGHELGDVAQTEPHSGTQADPHVLRINDRVAPEQLGRAWVHGITEGLQHEAASDLRIEPQGLIRRAMSRIANLFGGHDAAEVPGSERHTDALTDARLNERRYLVREYWSADSVVTQLRVRQDLASLDHELNRAGYPVHELEQVPQPAAQHNGEPTVANDGRDHSTHDEIWNDPPWRQEGRRPSLDELIPSSDEEAAKWEPQVQEALGRELDGREFAGMKIRLGTASDHPVSAYRNSVTVRLDIVHPDRGMVGSIVRVFIRDYDGSLFVEHSGLRLSSELQGTGFARQWNRYMEDWYRYSGVDHIEVHAASTVGGYAWARDGYDWMPGSEHRAIDVFNRLRAEMRVLNDEADQVQRFLAGDTTVDIDALRQRYHLDNPQDIRAEIGRQHEAGQQILDRAARYSFGRPGYPTPLEVSRAGWTGEHGPGATWLGKRAMLGANWRGVKPISEGGPNFPRSGHIGADLASDGTIHAWSVPGGEFGGHTVAPSEAHAAELMAATPQALARAVDGHGGLSLEELGDNRYRIIQAGGSSFTVRVETQWLGVDAAAETHLNHDITEDHDNGRHVIQLSDQLSVAHVERALAHEIGEIVEDRARFLRGESGVQPDALRSGEFTRGSRLSPHDAGRIQELRVLGTKLDELGAEEARTPEQQLEYQRLHREALALVDHLGLRDGDLGAPERRQLVFGRLEDAATAARVDTLLRDAGRAEADMTPAERAELAEVRHQAELDQARLDALQHALEPSNRPIAFDGRHITAEQARALADQATRARALRAERTLRQLRQLKAERGDAAAVRLQLGGGASLAGRDPNALLVDDRGRWQSDNGTRIAQTADQLRNLNRTGLGDPYQFVDGPGQRLPLEAVRYWEDSIAASGPVVDGAATLRIEHGTLVVDIRPDGTDEVLTFQVEGRPVIATGFPPETIPGVTRGLGVRGTFAELSARLSTLGTPEALRAKEAVDGLSWYDTGSAGRALTILGDNGIDTGVLEAGTARSLAAIHHWHDARDVPADRLRLLYGDEANLSRVDPTAAHKWVVAGAGGTGISGVENMLRLTDNAPDKPEFVMVGTRPPAGLGDNTQWHEVRSRYDPGYDPKNPYESSHRLPGGDWPNPNPPGGARLMMVLDTRLADFKVSPDGHTYTALGTDLTSGRSVEVSGDGMIASLGDRAGFPPAIAEMVDGVLKRDASLVSRELLFDNGGQYLGYRVSVEGQVVDVTGAASRFLPATIFPRADGYAPMHPPSGADDSAVWSTPDRRYVAAANDPTATVPQESASRRDAPPESGNFEGGYVATAVQATHYAAFAREDAPPTQFTGGEPGSGHPPTTGGSGHPGGGTPDGRLMFTGAAIRPMDDPVAFDWAAGAYDRFRLDNLDVAEIAQNLSTVERPSGAVGFSAEEIGTIKRHLMVDEHRIEDQEGNVVRRRLDPSPDVAEAWIRLREGRPLPADLVLLEHELTEANYLRDHPDATYLEAHEYTTERYNWEAVSPGRTGESLDGKWGRGQSHGDSGLVQEDPRGSPGGRVQLRIPGARSPLGDRDGFGAGQTPGWEHRPEVPGGAVEDPGGAAPGRPLAGEGHLRRLTFQLGDRVAQLPHQVMAAMDTVLEELVRGRAGVPNEDLPYRGEWDPVSQTILLHYPDGLEVRIAHQVDPSLGAGHPVVHIPDRVLTPDGWRAHGTAVVVLPADLPVDAPLHLQTVRSELAGAWQLLHQELAHPNGHEPVLTDPQPAEPPDAEPVPAQRPAGPPPPSGPPVGTLHVLGFDAGIGLTHSDYLTRLATGLGGIGDRVALRMPDTVSGELAPGVSVLGAQRLPGITGPISSLLRPDGLPGDVDLIVGYGQTAGIADVRLDAYPHAKVVQLLDAAPEAGDRAHWAVLAKADLVLAVGPEVASELRAGFSTLDVGPVPEVRDLPPAFEPKPVPSPRAAVAGYRLLVHGGDPAAMDQAAAVVAELAGRGITDVRLTVTMRATDPDVVAATGRRLAMLAGVAVDVLPMPDGEQLTAALHRADLVLVPGGGPGFDEAFVAAAEHGVPVLVDGESGAGRFLSGGHRVPDYLGEPDVVGRPAGGADMTAWTDRVQGALTDLGGERIRALGLREYLTRQYDPPAAARELHEALRGVAGRVARVDDVAWHRELNPREVVLRRAISVDPPVEGRPRVMTTCTEWRSKLGGVPTANRELTEAFGAAGAEVYSRVSKVDFEDPSRTSLEPAPGVRVLGVPEVWGVLDEKFRPDTRAMIMLLDNLPPEVDVIVGHSRFSGGAATWLAEHVYPDAQYVHVLHTSPEVLDALRGTPAEGLAHAATERQLMAEADLVAGVGPLLGREAARLSLQARPEDPPPVHEIISDMPSNGIDPPGRPPDRVGYELTVQGRAGDPIKGVDFAARLVAELRAQGVDVRLTVRGAPSVEAAVTQAELLSEIAGEPVVVKEFTPVAVELRGDLHHADLVMMPSIHEGFGLVASEAARAGVPVVVGEGTGAGMFFGDPKYLPPELGEAATVRDGVTVEALRQALREAETPDGSLSEAAIRAAVERISQERMAAWVEHVKATLADLDAQRQRALALRTFLDQNFPTGNAARRLLDAMGGEGHEGAGAPEESGGPTGSRGGGAAAPEIERPDGGTSTLRPAPKPAPAGDIGAILRGHVGVEPAVSEPPGAPTD